MDMKGAFRIESRLSISVSEFMTWTWWEYYSNLCMASHRPFQRIFKSWNKISSIDLGSRKHSYAHSLVYNVLRFEQSKVILHEDQFYINQ